MKSAIWRSCSQRIPPEVFPRSLNRQRRKKKLCDMLRVNEIKGSANKPILSSCLIFKWREWLSEICGNRFSCRNRPAVLSGLDIGVSAHHGHYCSMFYADVSVLFFHVEWLYPSRIFTKKKTKTERDTSHTKAYHCLLSLWVLMHRLRHIVSHHFYLMARRSITLWIILKQNNTRYSFIPWHCFGITRVCT